MSSKIIIGILIVFGAWIIYTYNRLITLKNRVKEAFSDIEVQLKRRHNLIPNLIEVVKGYASHEREVFEKVTEARSKAIQAQGLDEKAAAEENLSSVLKTLFAVAENYPQLRASENFKALQEEWTDTEDKIQAARRFYNGSVLDYNVKIESFPSNLIAKIFNFQKAEFFETKSKEEKEVPKANF